MKIINIISLTFFLPIIIWGQTVSPTSAEGMQPAPVESNFSSYFSKRKSFVDKDTKEISASEQAELDMIVTSASEIDQDSYQYNYMEYINRGRTIDAFEYLEKAEAAYPNNADLFDDFVYHYELIGNNNQKKIYCNKLHESNTIPGAIMEYNYNVLMSLDQDAVLLTNGSDDTFPIFIWQSIKNIRPDVTIINLDMLNEAKYVANKANEGGLKIKIQESTFKTMSYIIDNNGDKKIFVGHTISQKILKKYKDNLYLSGLTYQYSKKPVENVQVAVTRFENDFDLKELKQNQSNSKVYDLNFNYILPLITFIEYYKATGEQKKYTETKELAIKIARRVDKEAFILDYLSSKGL